jgi:hypothetical protein
MSEAPTHQSIDVDAAAVAGGVEFVRAFSRDGGHKVVCLFNIEGLTGPAEDKRYAVAMVLAMFARHCAEALAREHQVSFEVMLLALVRAAAAELTARRELTPKGAPAIA